MYCTCTCMVATYNAKKAHTHLIDTFVVPSELQSLETISSNSSSVTLQWRPPVTPNGIITQYSLQYNTTAVANTTNNVLMYTVSGLSPETVYVLQVRAHTSVGAGSPSSVTVITRKLTLLYIVWVDISKVALTYNALIICSYRMND